MTYEIRVGSLPTVPLFWENGITIIRGYEVVVSVPRQPPTWIFDVWVFNSEFFVSHSYLSCTPILLLNDIQINSSPEKFP
jgi:hypothetical protein